MAADADFNDLSGHVIVCGMGHVGYRVVRLLIRLGQRGVVITRETNDDWRAEIQPHFAIVSGDARRDDLLCQAGIARARAILVVTSDDLANVSIALDARRLNPTIVIAVRLFDQELATHFEKTARFTRAMSTSALAAPAFMAASLGDSVRGTFVADETCWIIRDQEVPASPSAPTIHEWSRKTGSAPLALTRGEEVVLTPSADTLLLAGDIVTALEVGTDAASSGPRLPGSQNLAIGTVSFRRIAGSVRDSWRAVPLALRTALFALLAVVLLSVAVFHLALGLPVADSIYFVVTTITTVGYGDYSLKDAPTWLKIYDSFLMLCGAAILAVLFSIVTDLVLQARLRELLARGRARSKGHIIVAGLGKIGFRLVRDLVRNGHSVVAIEHRQQCEFLQPARELTGVILGNAKTPEILRKAGVAGAKAVIAVTDDDLANLSIALATKRSNGDCRVVLRIFDSTLAEKMQHSLGVDAVLSVSGAAAPTLVGSILCPDVVQGVVLRDGLMMISYRTVDPRLPPVGLHPNRLFDHGTALLLKPAGDSAFRHVQEDDRLRPGDRLLGAWWRPFHSPA